MTVISIGDDWFKKRDSKETDCINEILKEKEKSSVSRFMQKISVENLLEYTDAANAKYSCTTPYSKFKYFCGICHKVIKQQEGIDG
jgi:hypothetical protein